ncbi:alpha/beta fold hydrolase [Sulfurirhabdus autotrophica]|uniref:Pimeloyl-ACP methyl ester carboxylesterase n=1 Tax=Sulfurirhabdus autotrophica TaxID=1706046 RepID=A0A4V2W1W9_9PROT|nr:alpha/beta hydrolase [Sulfurirhabdus autotrophica]TCV85839.1 pimeloyl-ACP methyl ester carboxylesterase [Sulfurirhabdus autotrophica]
MEERTIDTCVGRISLTIDHRGTGVPIIFLHGVFLDKSLWFEVSNDLPEITRIFIDMPAHGVSGDVGHDWVLEDCVEMLMQIINELKLDTCFLIGQSWGSMTALRAATKYPERFEALGLFNMPFKKTTGLRRLGFIFQKVMLYFPRFYAKQAAKSLYSREILHKRPELLIQMQDRLSKRSLQELSRVINAVILMPEDATHWINELQIPALAVIGQEDYVGKPPKLETWTVPGGHISPHESIEKVKAAILKVLDMKKR